LHTANFNVSITGHDDTPCFHEVEAAVYGFDSMRHRNAGLTKFNNGDYLLQCSKCHNEHRDVAKSNMWGGLGTHCERTERAYNGDLGAKPPQGPGSGQGIRKRSSPPLHHPRQSRQPFSF